MMKKTIFLILCIACPSYGEVILNNLHTTNTNYSSVHFARVQAGNATSLGVQNHAAVFQIGSLPVDLVSLTLSLRLDQLDGDVPGTLQAELFKTENNALVHVTGMTVPSITSSADYALTPIVATRLEADTEYRLELCATMYASYSWLQRGEYIDNGASFVRHSVYPPGGGTYINGHSNLSLRLEGTPVPEPASALSLVIGASVFLRRRQLKRYN